MRSERHRKEDYRLCECIFIRFKPKKEEKNRKTKKGKAKEIREREKKRSEKEIQGKLLHCSIRERTLSLRVDGSRGLRQSIMLFMFYAFDSDISIYG